MGNKRPGVNRRVMLFQFKPSMKRLEGLAHCNMRNDSLAPRRGQIANYYCYRNLSQALMVKNALILFSDGQQETRRQTMRGHESRGKYTCPDVHAEYGDIY